VEGPFGGRQATTMGEAFPILTGLDDVKSCDWLACPYEEDNNK
jgi:hypothetical protein